MFNRQEKLVLFLMFMVNFLLITDFMVLMPMGKMLMALFDISAQKFSLMVAFYTLCAGLSGILFSIFADRFARKKVLLIGLSAFLFFEICSFFVSNFDQLLILRACMGAVVGIIGALLYTIISEVIPMEKRATAIGIILSAFALASIFGVPLGLYVSQTYEWKFSFVLLSFFAICILFSVWKFLPVIQQQVFGSQANLKKLFGHFQHADRKLSFLFIILLILGHFSLIPFLFPSIIANAEYPEKELPIIYLAGGLATIVGSVLFGRWADKWGKKKVFTITLLASLIPIYFVTNLGVTGSFSVVATVVCFFCLMGARMAPAMALVSETAPLSERGSFLSLINSFQQLAAALGAVLSGAIVIKVDDGKLLNFHYVGLLAILFSVASLVVIYLVPPRTTPT